MQSLDGGKRVGGCINHVQDKDFKNQMFIEKEVF